MADGNHNSASGPRVSETLYQHGRLAISHLFNAPAQDVPKYDLAEMNLISAYGLPGTEKMDMGAMLSTLNAWARKIETKTSQKLHLFQNNPRRFGSLARFRLGLLMRTLTKTIGVRYNPERVADPDNFEDPEDSFIHGLLGPRQIGTCASLPVLCTAIGRRLGYPLKLVLAPAHCFFRWDAPDERINIEFHEEGLNAHDDEHYKHWPFEWTPELHEKERNRPTYLISLTPQQELAYCAHTRASQLSIARRHDEALAAARVAYRLWPTHANSVWMTHLTTKKMYPERQFPQIPCEETSGKEAFAKLAKEKGVVIIDRPMTTANTIG